MAKYSRVLLACAAMGCVTLLGVLGLLVAGHIDSLTVWLP